MTQIKSILAVTVLGVAIAVSAPSITSAQVTEADSINAQSAILSAGSRASQIRHLKEIPSVGVIDLSYGRRLRLHGDIPDAAEFEISAQKNAGGVGRLQAALRANPVTRSTLADHGVAINRVVGVEISSNGSLRIYKLGYR
jgi:hypothetical protein